MNGMWLLEILHQLNLRPSSPVCEILMEPFLCSLGTDDGSCMKISACEDISISETQHALAER